MDLACAARRSSAEPDGYRRRQPEDTLLYQIVARHLATFLSQAEQGCGPGLPGFVRRELAVLLDCDILAKGYVVTD